MPSPVCLISAPLLAERAARTMSLWARRTSCAPALPSCSVRAVEDCMSVKRIATRPVPLAVRGFYSSSRKPMMESNTGS